MAEKYFFEDKNAKKAKKTEKYFFQYKDTKKAAPVKKAVVKKAAAPTSMKVNKKKSK
jgi:hypothetical protein